MGSWYVPSIKVRKVQSGQRCPGCSLYMHHKDMVAWAGDEGTVYLHDACAELLLTSIAEDVIHNMEPPGNDESPEAEETSGD